MYRYNIFVWIILYGLLAISAATGIKGLVYLALPLHGFALPSFVAGQLYVDKSTLKIYVIRYRD